MEGLVEALCSFSSAGAGMATEASGRPVSADLKECVSRQIGSGFSMDVRPAGSVFITGGAAEADRYSWECGIRIRSECSSGISP